MSMTHKQVEAAVQSIDQRTLTFIASQEIEDRDGDVISVAGIDTAEFLRNPILLADHDKTAVFGKVTKLWKATQGGHPTLLAKAQVLPKGVSARADQVYEEIAFGARKGISIGFIGVSAEPLGRGSLFRSIKLLEISSVAIPSCPTCMVTGKTYKENPMNNSNEIVFELIDDAPMFDIDPRELASTLSQVVTHATRNSVRRALNNALGRLDPGDDEMLVSHKSADASPDSDLARLNALCTAAAAGWRVAVEAMQEYIRRHGPADSLGNEDLEKLGRLVDASLAQLGHQEACAEQIRRIMRGEVATRSVGMRHLSQTESMLYQQRRERAQVEHLRAAHAPTYALYRP